MVVKFLDRWFLVEKWGKVIEVAGISILVGNRGRCEWHNEFHVSVTSVSSRVSLFLFLAILWLARSDVGR